MIKLNEIPLDYEPRKKILPKLPDYVTPKGYREPEMSEFDSAFLCGAIKHFRPKKILEVGVAGGATTAIILQALEDIGKPYEMHSVDIDTNFYRDKTKSVGFMATYAKENNLISPQSTLRGRHEFHLGKYLPQVIDEIGSSIDFVILDTVHSLPGEVLDFLVVLPYLKDDAIVVLHDMRLNQSRPQDVLLYATATLFATVTSKEKFLNFEAESAIKPYRYPDIGAFKINERTREHVENAFLSFVLTWRYIPDSEQTRIYTKFYAKHYPAELVNVFTESIKMNSENYLFVANVLKKNLTLEKFKPFITARIDIKLMSTEGDFEILYVSNENAKIEKPNWLQKDGIGYTIHSYAGKLDFTAKATVDGQVNLMLRGVDIRKPEDNSKRIPYWIDYTNLTVNNKVIFNKLTSVWHDKFYTCSINVKAGKEITVQVEWLPHRSDV